MTIGRLRAKMRKLVDEYEDEEMENGELNLVPYLDIVTNVIMFLMMTTTTAAALSNINVSAPTTGAVGGAAADSQPKHDLNLTVQISDKGFTIAASGAVLKNEQGDVPTIPKSGTNYNYAALTKKMRDIKESYADETKVIINANPDITYENVVAAMDAIRSDGPKALFPDVLLSAGVN